MDGINSYDYLKTRGDGAHLLSKEEADQIAEDMIEAENATKDRGRLVIRPDGKVMLDDGPVKEFLKKKYTGATTPLNEGMNDEQGMAAIKNQLDALKPKNSVSVLDKPTMTGIPGKDARYEGYMKDYGYEQPNPDAPGAYELGEATARKARQAAGGLAELPGQFVYGLPQLLTFPVEKSINMVTGTGTPVTDFLQGRTKKNAEIGDTIAGGEATDLSDKMARNAAGSVVTGGAIGAGAKAAVSGLIDVASSVDLPSMLRDVFGGSAVADAPKPDLTTANPHPTESEAWGTAQAIALAGVSTAALIIGPMLARKFTQGRVTAPRPVRNLDNYNVKAISTPWDLFRSTEDDASAGAMNIMRRVAPVDEAAAIRTAMDTQTRASANALASQAVENGVMHSGYIDFNVGTSLAALKKRVQGFMADQSYEPVYNDYLVQRHNLDEILKEQGRRARLAAQGRATPTTPIIVNGVDEGLALQRINLIERAHPEVRAVSNIYRENLAEVRRAVSDGEFGLFSRRTRGQRNQVNGNMVFGPDGKRPPLDITNFEWGSPITNLGDYTKDLLVQRMHNEAKGQYIDGWRRNFPDGVRQVDKSVLDRNPALNANLVTLTRRGVKEYYLTDPFIAGTLKLDPLFANNFTAIGETLKNTMTATTTGVLAGTFLPTAWYRNYATSKVTVPNDMYKPSMAGSLAAIPMQATPHLIKGLSVMFGRNPVMRGLFTDQGADNISHFLAGVYDRSFTAQLEARGFEHASPSMGDLSTTRVTHTVGSAIERARQHDAVLDRALNTADDVTKPFISAWKVFFNSVHAASHYNLARRNTIGTIGTRMREQAGAWAKNHMDLDEPETMRRVLNMAGNPRIRGEVGLPFESAGGFGNTAAIAATRGIGTLTEGARLSIPWTNTSIQSIKRVGEAYLENPVRFVARAWGTVGVPAMVGYFWNKSQGPEYTKYQNERRSEYRQLMFDYVAIPGRPPEEGLELPKVHEDSILSALAVKTLHHLTSPGEMDSEQMRKEWGNIAKQWLGVVFVPPSPPVLNLAISAYGGVPPQSVIGDTMYTARKDYGETEGTNLPGNVEAMMRQVFGTLADIVGYSYASFTNNDGSFAEKLSSAARGAVSKATERSSIVRDIFNVRPPVSGDTPVGSELYKNNKLINNIAKFWNDKINKEGDINTKPRSKEGLAAIQSTVAAIRKATGDKTEGSAMDGIPSQIPGVAVRPPTNELFNMFANDLYRDFATDTKGPDIQGYLTAWAYHADLTKALDSLKKVNHGNMGRWQKELQARPEVLAFLKGNNVDPTNLRAVQNFFIMRRQDVQKYLSGQIKSALAKMSKRAGREIKIEDLEPYSGGGPAEREGAMVE